MATSRPPRSTGFAILTSAGAICSALICGFWATWYRANRPPTLDDDTELMGNLEKLEGCVKKAKNAWLEAANALVKMEKIRRGNVAPEQSASLQASVKEVDETGKGRRGPD